MAPLPPPLPPGVVVVVVVEVVGGRAVPVVVDDSGGAVLSTMERSGPSALTPASSDAHAASPSEPARTRADTAATVRIRMARA
jgi:hypothetical protein